MVLEGHANGVYSAVFSADGQRVVTASEDGTARVWDQAGRELQVLEGHTGPVRSARFSEDGKWVVTNSEDGTARIWPVDFDYLLDKACERLRPFLHHSPEVSEADRGMCD